MKGVLQTTSFHVEHYMNKITTRVNLSWWPGWRKKRLLDNFVVSFAIIFSVAMLMSSCTTSGYWIPPNQASAGAGEIDILFNTPLPTRLAEEDTSAQLENTNVAGETSGSGSSRAPEGSATPTGTTIYRVPDTATPAPVNTAPILYYSQAADTLPVVAVRFGVAPEEITSPEPLPENDLLPPNQLLIIPRSLANTTSSQRILPDSELVYSPSATDFDTETYVTNAGGYLSRHKEWFQSTGTLTGAQIIERVAIENSINPRLLLALLEFQSGLVYGEPGSLADSEYPLGHVNQNEKGLFRQLIWAVNHLSVGYYSWREGRLIDLDFSDGVSARLAPDLNAGSIALQYYFAQIYDSEQWVQALDLENGFPALYEEMFGTPWGRAQSVEPLYPPGLKQPQLILPFDMERLWSYTGGPHGAWEHDGSYAAVDFAPASSEPGCQDSNAWVVASASGLVVRSGKGVVVLDLDGDGLEQTGWVVLHLHVSNDSSVPVGTWVNIGDHLGHPSCEGGMATGTHVHIARKYNGEWIAADGPMPFVLSGWRVHAGEEAYLGTLTRGDEIIPACTCGSYETRIMRMPDDPY